MVFDCNQSKPGEVKDLLGSGACVGFTPENTSSTLYHVRYGESLFAARCGPTFVYKPLADGTVTVPSSQRYRRTWLAPEGCCYKALEPSWGEFTN